MFSVVDLTISLGWRGAYSTLNSILASHPAALGLNQCSCIANLTELLDRILLRYGKWTEQSLKVDRLHRVLASDNLVLQKMGFEPRIIESKEFFFPFRTTASEPQCC